MKLSQIPEGGKGERHGAGRNSPGPTSLIQIPFFSRGKTPLHIPLLFAVRGRIPTLGMQTDFAQKIHARLGKFLLRFVGLMQRARYERSHGQAPKRFAQTAANLLGFFFRQGAIFPFFVQRNHLLFHENPQILMERVKILF